MVGSPWFGFVTLFLVASGVAAAPPAAGAQDGRGSQSPGEVRYPVDPSSSPRPVARATRTPLPITLDGRLEEPAWGAAEAITDFVQKQPNLGALATEQTVVRILFDDQNLYMGIVCYDSDPENIVVASLERDFGGKSPRDFDAVSITLDPFLDRRNAFLLHVNPVGATRDAQVTGDGRIQNVAWAGVWHAEAAVTDSGWVAELAIPWTTLRFDPNREEQVWGLNLQRRVRWKNEESVWSPLERHEPSHRMSRAGTLVGLEGLRSGNHLSVKPYGLVADVAGALPAEEARGVRWDGGVDVKYGLTARTTVDLTYRTDFSHADEDQEIVNLTRFSVFRPERREFFLENAGIFGFGDQAERGHRMGASPSDFTLFHSRRIGLTQDGRRVPIRGGIRVTGKQGPFDVGILAMQTEAAHGLPAETFSVFRLRQEILEGSDVGVMFINRQPFGDQGEEGYNRSLGVDLNLRPSAEMVINSYVARSLTQGVDGDELAWRVSAAWRDRFWDASALVRHIGEAFEPGAGFARRGGVRHHYATLGVHHRVPVLQIQETNPYVEGELFTDPASVVETRNLRLGLDTEFLDGGVLSLALTDRFERLFAAFPLSDGVEVPEGEYGFIEGTLSYTSSAARALAARVGWAGGGYFEGTRNSFETGLVWRPDHRWSLDASAQRNNIRLGPASFTADVVSLQAGYSHSRRLLGRLSVQYNGATDQLITNLRLNLIHAPLSDFFIVLTERRDLGADLVLERGLTAKVTRLLAF